MAGKKMGGNYWQKLVTASPNIFFNSNKSYIYNTVFQPMVMYKNILLIDDDPEDQEIFFEAVAKISTTIKYIASSDATSALRKLTAKELTPDVIFLDLNMPVMTGQQFLAAIKKEGDVKEIPVIIFSTTSQVETIELAKQLGALDFITKPSTFSDLIRILTPLLT